MADDVMLPEILRMTDVIFWCCAPALAPEIKWGKTEGGVMEIAGPARERGGENEGCGKESVRMSRRNGCMLLTRR